MLKGKFGTKKYHSNLLGESLEDLLRKATAKTLDEPDEMANAQVVQAINEDSVHAPRDIVILLKRRLEMENPQKQYLAVVLLGKILQECQGMVSPYQEELLHDVAAIMTRPSRRDSPASQRAKGAARDLLRTYGRTGYDAIRNAARANYAGARPGAQGAEGVRAGGGVPGAVERASLVDEVTRMVDTARGHTELLQDMLVNSAEPGVQEMELQLMQELLQEVRELRAMFTPYLEQLGALEGDDVEKTMCDALEAVDMLDNAIALQREVAVAQSEVPTEGAPQATPLPAAPAPAAAVAAPAAAPVAKSAQKDLIDLSDLSETLPSPTPKPNSPPAATIDPFAAVAPLVPSPLPTAQSAPQPQPQPQLGMPHPSANLPAQATYPNYPQQYTGGVYPVNSAPYPMQPQMGQYPPQMTGGYIASPPTSPTYHNNMYSRPMMSPPQPMAPIYGMPMAVPQMQPQQPMYPVQTMSPPPHNPFAPPPMQPMGFADNAFHPQQGPPQAFSPTASSNNPFAAGATSPPQPGPNAIDREWDLLFADKNNPQAAAAHN